MRKGSGEDEHVNPLRCFPQQCEPGFTGDTGPVTVGARKFVGKHAAPPCPARLRARPEEGLFYSKVLGGAETVPRVRDAPAQPAADGLGIHFTDLSERLRRDAALGKYRVEPLVHENIQAEPGANMQGYSHLPDRSR